MPKYLVEGEQSFFIYLDGFSFSMSGTKHGVRRATRREAQLCREIFRLGRELDNLRGIVDQLQKAGLDLPEVLGQETTSPSTT